MKRITMLALVLVLMVFAAACGAKEGSESQGEKSSETAGVAQEEVAEIMPMSGQELVDYMKDEDKMKEAVVVDVRTEEEYAAGHIEGAINVSLDDIQMSADALEEYKDKTIILYCNTANRSGQAAVILVNAGYQKVYNAEGVKRFNYNLVKN